MRRDSRKLEKREKNKSLIYIGGSILAIGILVFAIAFVHMIVIWKSKVK